MKQHITKEQWDETDIKIQSDWIHRKVKGGYAIIEERPAIGQMIEFLENDFDSIHLSTRFEVVLEDTKTFKMKSFKELELCDALWEAVKYKLTK